MVRRKLSLVLAALSSFLSCGLPATAQTDLAFTRAQHLRRGINLSMWYAQAPGHYTAERLARLITPADFKLIHDLGFDHVRLSIDPEPLIAADTIATEKAAGVVLDPAAMARLSATAQQITDAGLIVVLDIHPETPWKRYSTTSPKGIATYLSFWASFARYFAHTDPTKVYFELLNEPEGLDPADWAKEQARAVPIIRAQVPHHTLIVGGANWNSIDTLVNLQPLADTNLIYTFHDYEPMEFTHQGANWAGEKLKPLRNVPYPSSPEAVAPLLPTLTDEWARKALASYGDDRWTITRMKQRIGLAKDWGRQHHVPLWCGEFGVYRDFAPHEDRARWITDMRSTLEADGIGWNMWDYQAAFGLVTKKDGVTNVDPLIAKALGVKTSTPGK
jgi:aryl-phospho-beta-D-glucosidase BglC (GH1 family)